jgi:hypothetical protein
MLYIHQEQAYMLESENEKLKMKILRPEGDMTRIKSERFGVVMQT